MSVRRPLLLPLVPLYAAGQRLERWLHDHQREYRRSLANPVLSIGSISAGGAGKTPVVLALAQLLQEREYAVRILTRGYKRSSQLVERVDPAGDAERFGDEPLLLAQRSRLPIVVGADRYEAGLLAERSPSPARIVHLLDDGFQHRQLVRDLDLVLLTRSDVNDVLLPAGNLREPLTALRRADVIVLRADEADSLQDFLAALTRETGAPLIWRIRRSLRFPASATLAASRPLAFCGIARPESFFTMLTQAARPPASTMTFPDHHRYTARDTNRLLDQARRIGADGFLTTEKDAVKLPPALRDRLSPIGPLLVPQLEVTFVDEPLVLAQLVSLVPRLDRRQTRRSDRQPDKPPQMPADRNPDRNPDRLPRQPGDPRFNRQRAH